MDQAIRGYSLCGVVWYRTLRVNVYVCVCIYIYREREREDILPEWCHHHGGPSVSRMTLSVPLICGYGSGSAG